MSISLSRALGCLWLISGITAASAPAWSADDAAPLQKAGYNTLSITNVTWAVGSGGVGKFAVTIANTGTSKAFVTGWASATSAGAPTLRTNLGTLVPGQTQTLALSPTANGRCYQVAIALDPDAGSNGIRWDGVSRNVCLDPDGGGIIPSK